MPILLGPKFKEPGLAALDLTDPATLSDLMIGKLCGELHYATLTVNERELLAEISRRARDVGLDYAEFNELLLMLNQDRVSQPFFEFFWAKPRVKLADIVRGVVRFRGFALLCFGNFRFAYKRLSQTTGSELRGVLGQWAVAPSDRLRAFTSRPEIALKIRTIAKDKTWQLGYVSKRLIESDMRSVQEMATRVSDEEAPRVRELLHFYGQLGEERLGLEDIGLRNTEVYLSWDYMDVYVATSMRQPSEFSETAEFIAHVFGNAKLKPLRLRWFDPTQSAVPNRIDKGLVEGLMLKRAECTIYMAQEYDTMGKDSELAATLAQGKPVVAFVPGEEKDSLLKKVKRYPLDFVERRLLIHRAEGLYEDASVLSELGSDRAFVREIEEFLTALTGYRTRQPLLLWEEENEKFKKSLGRSFARVCQVLAELEYRNYQKRNDLLSTSHPLALQVNLASGVANGVLVVRGVDDCAELVRRILLNKMTFSIEHEGVAGMGVTVLREAISKCPFRVVTDHEKLTNSFWNFYTESENRD